MTASRLILRLLASASVALAPVGALIPSPALAVVNTSTTMVTSNGNGATTVWNYSFPIPYQPNGITPAVVVSTVVGGVTTVLDPSLYTITGVGTGSGGSVTYPLVGSPLANGSTITITRAVSFVQPYAVGNTSFYPHTVEKVGDWLEYQLQQINTSIGAAGVASFNTRTGFVLPVAGDYTCALVTGCPQLGVTNTWTVPQNMQGPSAGGLAQVLSLQNSSADASGDAAGLDLFPSATGCKTYVVGYRDGGATNSGLQLWPCLASSQSVGLQLSSAGALRLPAYTTGLAQMDASGNLTATGEATAHNWTAVQTYKSTNAGGVSLGVLFQNTTADASGDGIGVEYQPSATGCFGIISAYRDGSAANTGFQLSPCLANTRHTYLSLSSAGVLQLPAYGTGLLQSDSSGNITSANPIGTSGATVPLLNTANTWSAKQTFSAMALSGATGGFIQSDGTGNLTAFPYMYSLTGGSGQYVLVDASLNGAPSPSNGVALELIGPQLNAGEQDLVDGYALGGTPGVKLNRYNCTLSGGVCTAFTPVLNAQNVGVFGASAFTGSGNPTDAMLAFIATEDQTVSHNGVGPGIWYTPNGTTALTLGLSISAGGLGGVAIGHSTGGTPFSTMPTDRGAGTLHVDDEVVTDNHLTTTSAKYGQPSVPTGTCGGATAALQEGTDQAGLVKMGSGTPGTSCVVNFARTWVGSNPVCQVQPFNNNTVTAWVSTWSATSFTITTSGNYTGQISFICMGIG